MSRRWREDDEAGDVRGPLRRRRTERAGTGRAVSKADAAAAILWTGATLYAVFGGADFGARRLGPARRRRARRASGRER